MIDECIWEVKVENLNLKNENLFPSDFSKKESKRRKRIRDAYNEIEYGYKIRRKKR